MADKRPPNRPAIIVGHSEHRKLTKIAEAHLSKNAVVSDELLYELERAHVVDDHRLPRGIIRLGSTVRFTSDLGEDRTVTLVLPGEANIAEGKISILTPIGTALIGLRAGQSIDWTARDGQLHRLTVEWVSESAELGQML
ncbi:regulator of nucleoside diphosphate kinase [Rhizobium sp. BK512]|uniref:nucleoside diphosphate kinase regulator n=1 Tax=Rhizobium sp. BK512 TaxID=2587010 RepID=UPI000DDDF4E2|nr:nucleoside diphosphate kinase regulator [Rhizobium sp. BK512]MBB3562873.1 regulator of nucleoside diphosphate kinase [Rhizobium sp. BK512]